MFKRVAMVFLAIVMALSIGVGGVACNRGRLVDESLDEEGNIDMNKPLVIRFAAPEGQFGDEIEMFAKGLPAVGRKNWLASLLRGTHPTCFGQMKYSRMLPMVCWRTLTRILKNTGWINPIIMNPCSLWVNMRAVYI